MTLALLNEIGIETSFVGNKIVVCHAELVSASQLTVESDWSSASYWYSIVALSKIGTQITLSSYKENSLQGDSALVTIYQDFGVETTFNTDNSITISKINNCQLSIVNYQLNGIVGIDEVELTNTAVFEQTNVGQNIAVTPNFELAGLHADRYTLVQPTGVSGSIVKADQVITFGVLPSKVFGDVAFTISATGGASGQPIVFTSSDESIATVSGNQVTKDLS